MHGTLSPNHQTRYCLLIQDEREAVRAHSFHTDLEQTFPTEKRSHQRKEQHTRSCTSQHSKFNLRIKRISTSAHAHHSGTSAQAQHEHNLKQNCLRQQRLLLMPVTGPWKRDRPQGVRERRACAAASGAVTMMVNWFCPGASASGHAPASHAAATSVPPRAYIAATPACKHITVLTHGVQDLGCANGSMPSIKPSMGCSSIIHSDAQQQCLA